MEESRVPICSGDGEGVERQGTSLRPAWWALAVNLLLAAAKLAGGWLFFSEALLADGVHSLGDAAGSATVLYGLRFSSHPPDEDHPYGHEKAETLASFAVGLVLVVSGLALCARALEQLVGPTERQPGWAAFFIAGLALCAKEVMYFWMRSAARRSDSAGYWANAVDSRMDAWSSGAAMAGILGSRLGLLWADAAAAMLVSLLVVWAGLEVLRGNLPGLLETRNPRLEARVRTVVIGVPGVGALHSLRTRLMGSFVLIDVRIGVDEELTVRAGHEIARRVAAEVHRSVPRVREVFVHVDPLGEGQNERDW